MIAAVIPTIPGREALLEQALESVHAQTVPADQVIVALDERREGPAAARNRGVQEASTDWVAFLDDDDVWYPNHLETLLQASGGADVVYSDCALVGPHSHPDLNRDFDPFLLQLRNFIPVTALVRRNVFLDVGGFDPADDLEDWGLWKRLASAGCRFVHVPVTTWEYRFHRDGQRTFGG